MEHDRTHASCDQFGEKSVCKAIYALVNSLSPAYPLFVHKVIDQVQALASQAPDSIRVRTLVEWTERCLWFGWRQAHKVLDQNSVLPHAPSQIKINYLLLVIAIGTGIAYRQKDAIAKGMPLGQNSL
jgi:hypothetical protein